MKIIHKTKGDDFYFVRFVYDHILYHMHIDEETKELVFYKSGDFLSSFKLENIEPDIEFNFSTLGIPISLENAIKYCTYVLNDCSTITLDISNDENN